MTALKYIGDLLGVPDEMLADLLRNPSQARTMLMELFDADVPGIVVRELGKAPTVEAAAASAVAGKLAAADVLMGGDRRGLPGGPGGKSGWYEMPESTGYKYAYVEFDERDWYIVGGFTLAGYWKAHTEGEETAGSSLSRDFVADAIPEWWVGRPQLNLDTVTTGALGQKGEVLAIDFNARTGPVATQVAVAPVDDHNVPAPCVVPGRGILMPWTWHGVDNLLRMVVAGGTGLGSTLRGKPEHTFTMGGNASYSQPWVLAHRRSGTTDTFWILVRVSLRWSIREIVVDWATGVPTATPGILHLVEFPEQAYMDTVPAAFDANGNVTKLGIIAGFNPSVNRDDVYLLELDLTTGIMHDKANPAVTHNIASGSPLQSSALTPVLANKTVGTRRVFALYTGGGAQIWKLLTCEYTGDVDPSGIVTEHSFDVSSRTVTGTRTFGAAGRHLERYPGGADFAPDGKVWHVNEADNIYTLSLDGVPVRRSTEPMIRPRAIPQGAHIDVLLAIAPVYVTFTNWVANMIALKKGA